MKRLSLGYLNKDTSSNRIVKKRGPSVEAICIEEEWTDDWSERLTRTEFIYDGEHGQLLEVR